MPPLSENTWLTDASREIVTARQVLFATAPTSVVDDCNELSSRLAEYRKGGARVLPPRYRLNLEALLLAYPLLSHTMLGGNLSTALWAVAQRALQLHSAVGKSNFGASYGASAAQVDALQRAYDAEASVLLSWQTQLHAEEHAERWEENGYCAHLQAEYDQLLWHGRHLAVDIGSSTVVATPRMRIFCGQLQPVVSLIVGVDWEHHLRHYKGALLQPVAVAKPIIAHTILHWESLFNGNMDQFVASIRYLGEAAVAAQEISQGELLPGADDSSTADPLPIGWKSQEMFVVCAVWIVAVGLLCALSMAIFLQHHWFVRRHLNPSGSYSEGQTCADDPLSTCVSGWLPKLEDANRVGFAFTNLGYTSPNGKNVRARTNPAATLPSGTHTRVCAQILRGVTGFVNPGQLVALMGASGSGKTTLLDVLSGQRRDGKISGEYYVNGLDLHLHNSQPSSRLEAFRLKLGYMHQLSNSFCDKLTVRENIAYAALLRLPGAWSTTDKLERADRAIHELGLRPICNVRVGGVTGGGISGGQKRKVQLAIEMLCDPAVLFLDEPTSGLDARSALEVVASLRKVCESGRSVVVSIHQPRIETFASFDTVLLLHRGGVAYFGRPLAGCRLLIEYASYLGKQVESVYLQGSNPADVMLDLMMEEGSISSGAKTNIGDFSVRFFEACGFEAAIKQAVAVGAHEAQVAPERLQHRQPATNLWVQLWANGSRKLMRSTYANYFSSSLATLVVAGVLAAAQDGLEPSMYPSIIMQLLFIPSSNMGYMTLSDHSKNPTPHI